MFRFTIRELVLLTVVVGLILGWWLDRRRSEDRNKVWQRQAADAWVARDQAMNRMAVAEERASRYARMAKQIQLERLNELVARESPSAPMPDSTPIPTSTERPITSEEAAEIVRRMILTEAGNKFVFDCKVVESSTGFLVFVDYGHGRDANGTLIGGFPGGHATYKLSKSGKLLEIFGGA